MSQAPGAPTDFVTEYGHSPPMCTQFSVFLENRVGKLYDLVEMLEEQRIHMLAFSILEASDHAVVRIVTTRPDDARRLLQSELIAFSEAEILVIELSEDQTLAQLFRALLSAELNIAYCYSLMVLPHGCTTVAITCDDQIFAGQVLQRRGFKLVTEEELSRAAGDEPGAA